MVLCRIQIPRYSPFPVQSQMQEEKQRTVVRLNNLNKPLVVLSLWVVTPLGAAYQISCLSSMYYS